MSRLEVIYPARKFLRRDGAIVPGERPTATPFARKDDLNVRRVRQNYDDLARTLESPSPQIDKLAC
jgi:hypothetical protein